MFGPSSGGAPSGTLTTGILMSLVRQTLPAAVAAGLLMIATAAGGADAGKAKNASGPGCAWLAKRVMLALLRDDIVAANDYQEMYKSFVCPAVRLADAFSCVVAEGAPESASETRERIDLCWADPHNVMASKAAAGSPNKAVKTPPLPKPAPSDQKPKIPEKPPAASSKSATPPPAKPPSAPLLPDTKPPYVK